MATNYGWAQLKPAISHVSLLLALTIYTAFGGYVFCTLEAPNEKARLEELQIRVEAARAPILAKLGTNHSEELKLLEDIIGEQTWPPPPPRWTSLQAIFFASTVITTIGYGNLVPATFWGRVFCILYALVGIPLTVTVLADLGVVLASAVSALGFPELEQGTRGRSMAAFGALGCLLIYLSAGAAMFDLWEEDWDFFQGFYFCFITMTTIGFGDLVPQRASYMLLCTIYILIGLSMTSAIVELVRRQYEQSWRQLQALSGPLAESLRRLGEGGKGVDVAALSRILAVITVPATGKGRPNQNVSKEQKKWEAAMSAMLQDLEAAREKKEKTTTFQIVIYETSV